MQYIKRDMEKLIINTSKEYSAILLYGPRQIGKSTVLENLFKNRTIVSLDDLNLRNLAINDPKMFLEIYKPPLLIDEIQYAPNLFPYIKMAIDRNATPGSYLLTGSQAFKLMKLAGESLAGRVALLHFSPFSQHEIYSDTMLLPFNLNINDLLLRTATYKEADIHEIYRRIYYGSMPNIINNKYSNLNLFYSSYLETYINRDINEENKINNSLKFLNFLTALAARIGQVLNLHNVAGECDISDDTAKRWLELILKSDVVYLLHPYSNNVLKRTIKSPKLYFFDTGLVAYLTKYHTPETLEAGALNGAVFENYVINEIRKTYFNLGYEPPLYYFHDKDGNEIDLLIEENGYIYPIEIKKTNMPNPSMIKAFNILRKNLIPTGNGAVICSYNNVSMLDNNTLIIPTWAI